MGRYPIVVFLMAILWGLNGHAGVEDFNSIIEENIVAQRELAMAVVESLPENEVILESVYLQPSEETMETFITVEIALQPNTSPKK